MKTQGRRVYPDPNEAYLGLPRMEPGDYGRDKDGIWHCCAPGQNVDTNWASNFHGCLGDGKTHHKIIEHEDGTITVSPSILISKHDGSWHGYLERGIWREV